MSDPWLEPRPEGVPVLAVVGTMNFGGRTPADESVRIVDRALERGLRFFDTANAYSNGESERLLGRALKGRRGEVRIATKVGIGALEGPSEGLDPETVRRALDESLERLGVDRIDLYYLHAPDPKTPVEATLDALARAQGAGKIRDWGVSNYASWQIADLVHRCRGRAPGPPRASQVIYNLLVRQLEVEYFAFAREFRIHTTVYNPLAGGLLAGRVGARFDDNPRYQRRYLGARLRQLAEQHVALAREAGIDPVAMAYGWLAQRPGVDSILVGPATVGQLDAALDGCAAAIPADVTANIDRIYSDYLGTEVRYAR